MFDVFFLSLLACSVALAGQQQAVITLEPVLTIGNAEDGLLYQWSGVTVDENQSIYITDLMDYAIKKFDRTGHFVNSVGKKGRAPGEFMSPTQIRHASGRLYISERTVPGIHVMDANSLTHRSRIPFPHPITKFAILSANEILLACFRADQVNTLTAIDSLGREQYTRIFGPERGGALGQNLLQTVDFVVDRDGTLVVAYEWRDMIQKMNRSDTLLWRRTLFSGQVTELKSIAGMRLPSKIVHKSLALDSSGRIFVLGGHFAKNPSRDITVLDTAGKPISRITLPEPSHLIYIDGMDHLYARSGRGTALVKFKIKYQ